MKKIENEKLVFLFKGEKENEYIALFEVGNGKAHNDNVILKKYAKTEKEALQWVEKIIPNRKWAENISLIEVAKRLIATKYEAPYCAGRDQLYYLEDKFVLNNGFEIDFSCSNEKKEKGCVLSWNSGSRMKPFFEEEFVRINPKFSYGISHGAGRSSKETIYVQDFKYEVVAVGSNFNLEVM